MQAETFMTGSWNYSRLFLLAFALAFFLMATLTRLNIPLAEWDHVILSAAEDWSRGIDRAWLFDHPPLYPSVLALVFRVFGSGAAVARAVNVAFVLLTALCVYRFAAKFFNPTAAFWALIVYLMHPVTIQGVSSLDMADTSMLPLLFLLTAIALRNLNARPTFGRMWVAGLYLGLCLWAKITSTIAWMAALGAATGVLWLLGERKSMMRLGYCLAAGISIGLATYLASSYQILNGLWGGEAFFWPLKAAYTAFMDRGGPDGQATVWSILYSMARIVVWFSPYFLLFFWGAVGASIKEFVSSRSDENRFHLWIGIAAVAYFLVHVVIGGTNWGFPRYHSAVSPIVCVLCGRFISGSMPARGMRGQFVFGSAIAVTAIITAIFVPDPIFFLNIRAKQMLLNHEGFLQLMGQALVVFLPLYGLSLLVALFVFRAQNQTTDKKAWGLFLTVGLLATTFSMDLQHAVASYRTTVQYGAAGKEELVKSVRAHLLPGDRVLAAPEFIYELRDLNVPRVSWEELRSRERFHGFVKQYSPMAIIGGLTVSSLDQLGWMLSKETGSFLSKTYRPHRVGTYYYWLREDAGRAHASYDIQKETWRP
jgi:hypothetical protein